MLYPKTLFYQRMVDGLLGLFYRYCERIEEPKQPFGDIQPTTLLSLQGLVVLRPPLKNGE